MLIGQQLMLLIFKSAIVELQSAAVLSDDPYNVLWGTVRYACFDFEGELHVRSEEAR